MLPTAPSLTSESLTVWIKRGVCTADSLINIGLFCLGYFPGLIHAWYIIFAYPDQYESLALDPENGGSGSAHHVTYYYVQQGPRSQRQHRQGHCHVPQGPGQVHVFPPAGSEQYRGYGTLGGGLGGEENASATAPSAGQFPGQQTGVVNSFEPGKGQEQRPKGAPDGSGAAAASDEVPPTYSEAIHGDHKVQRDD